MEITPAAPRRKTRQIMVGSVPVGGDAPVTVQSMTTTKTADVEGTLAQIYSLAAAGAATLGLWTAAAAHGPLLVHPGSSFIAATLGGMLLARPPAGSRPGRNLGAWAAALLVLVQLTRIDAAIDRVESLARSRAPLTEAADLPQRHEALRLAVNRTIAQIDALIAEDEA